MRKYLLFALSLFLLSACHESLEDKADREAKEFTRRNCPNQITNGITIDSMAFEKDSRTIHYYFSISGLGDTTAIDTVAARKEILKNTKDNTSIRLYKKNNFNFAYTYFSTKHKGQRLIDVKVTPKDYGGGDK